MGKSAVAAPAPLWPAIVGAIFLGLTVLFLMGLILLSVAGHPVPCEGRFLVAALLALTTAIGSSFLGGTAAAKGAIPWQGVQKHPISFAVTGGIAVFVVTLLLGARLYDGGPDCVQLGGATGIRGRVVDAAGAPVASAKVSITGVAAATTGNDGRFGVDVPGPNTGPLSLTVYAGGFAPLKRGFKLDGRDMELGDLQLARQ